MVQGLISAGGLPGPVRAEYERVGLLRDGQTYYLVEVGKDPVTQRGRALSTLRIGLAIIAGGAAAGVRRVRVDALGASPAAQASRSAAPVHVAARTLDVPIRLDSRGRMRVAVW